MADLKTKNRQQTPTNRLLLFNFKNTTLLENENNLL